jgi:hypothetical protein
VVGSVMSWVTVDSGIGKLTVSGLDGGDGKITLIAAMVAALLVYAVHRKAARRRLLLALTTAATLVIGGTALYDTFTVSDRARNIGAVGLTTAHVGLGLWIVDVAALAMLVGIFFYLRSGGTTSTRRIITVSAPAGIPTQRVESRNVTTVLVQHDESDADAEA